MAEDTPAEDDITDIDDTSGDDDSTSEDALAPVKVWFGNNMTP